MTRFRTGETVILTEDDSNFCRDHGMTLGLEPGVGFEVKHVRFARKAGIKLRDVGHCQLVTVTLPSGKQQEFSGAYFQKVPGNSKK